MVKNSNEDILTCDSSLSSSTSSKLKKKKKKKFPKCSHPECEVEIPLTQQIIGKCNKCNNIFCMQHRLPEMHYCSEVKDMSSEEKHKLVASMKCVANKV